MPRVTRAARNKTASTAAEPAVPPPPPPLPPTRARRSATSMPPKTRKPPGSAKSKKVVQAMTKINATKATTPKVRKEPFKPCHMFFYGSLMDPEVIESVLELPELPSLSDATITGFEIKMWDVYPTLVPKETKTRPATVSGKVWKITSAKHFKTLAKYETDAYTWCKCEATLSDGEVLKDCRVFCWAGDSDDEELSEGAFDLAYYQKHFKASVIMRK